MDSHLREFIVMNGGPTALSQLVLVFFEHYGSDSKAFAKISLLVKDSSILNSLLSELLLKLREEEGGNK